MASGRRKAQAKLSTERGRRDAKKEMEGMMDKMMNCLKNGELLDGIANSRLQGNREFGIASPPSFLLGDRKIDGYLPWPEFDALLADAVGCSRGACVFL